MNSEWYPVFKKWTRDAPRDRPTLIIGDSAMVTIKLYFLQLLLCVKTFTH